MIPARYPAADWEPVSYTGNASLMSNGSLGWIEHIVVGNGDPHDLFEHAPAGNRRFSHMWFAKNGRVAQYQDLRHDSWAQVGGNDSYWSCETEGNPSEPLTEAQLDALAAWHVWSGTVDAIATVPGQRGIGTHAMGGAAWGGHECPGAIRAAQRPEILRRAAALRQGDPVTQDEIDRIAVAVLKRMAGWQPPTGEDPLPNWQTVVSRTYTNSEKILSAVSKPTVDVAVLAAALEKLLPAGARVNPRALARAVADELHRAAP